MVKGSDSRGLSTIVATLLIILLILVAVGIIWVVVRNVVQGGREQISLGKFTSNLEISQVEKINDTSVNVKVKRDVSGGEIAGIVLIFYDDNNSEVVKYNISMGELEVRNFTIVLNVINTSNIKKVSIAPIFKLESGKEVTGDVNNKYNVSNISLFGGAICTPACSGKNCGSDGCGGNCGSCTGGEICNGAGQCVITCTDKCSSLGYSCGIHLICGVSTNCGSCGGGGGGGSGCTDTCLSLNYNCGTQTVCGLSTNCGSCSGEQTCNSTGRCVTTATCSDRIQNQGETGIDCGGPCSACVTYLRTFYVSNSGNDNNNGTTPSSSWKTIAKINSQTFRAGDGILFKRGDTWYGTLTISQSGNSTFPITFGAYSSGVNPIITGFTTVSAWTNLGSNIWESTSAVSTLSTCNMVVINGVNTPMGRYPNTGYYKFQSHSGSTSITSSSLSGTPDWTGAEVVINGYAYVLDRLIITSQSSGTLIFSPATTYEPANGYGFFIQNDVRTLDTQGEWYYNPSTKKLRVYSVGSPTGVEVASVSTLVTVNAKYITLDHLTLRGANAYTVYNNIDAVSSNLTIQNCSLLFSGNTLVDIKYTPNFTIENCVFSDANNNGILIREDCAYAIIRNNTIENIGLIPGAGQSSSGTYTAIQQRPNDGILMEYNNLTNIGYDGINFFGDNVLIQYNLINRFGLILDDCGGIYTGGMNVYTGGEVGVEHVNNKILNNIVLNGIGEFSGTPSTASHTSGIYLDYNSNHVEISGNTAANCGNKGVFMTSTHDISMDNNTFYNNNEQLTFQQFSAEYYSERNTYTNNIYFSKGANQFTYRYYDQVGSGAGDIPTSDYNYYARPIDDDKTFVTFIYGVDVSEQRKTLAEWRTFSGQDAHSHKSPKSITNLNDLLFEYNPTAANKVVALSGSYVDVRNVSYSGSVTLKPFTSIVLIKN